MKNAAMIALTLGGFALAALDPVLFFWIVLAWAIVAGSMEYRDYLRRWK